MRRDVAERVHLVLFDAYSRVCASLELVRGTCPPDEFKSYARGVGAVMGELLSLLEPLWREHPDLLPDHYESPIPQDPRDRAVVRVLEQVPRVAAVYALRPRVEDTDYYVEVSPWRAEDGLVPEVHEPLLAVFGHEGIPHFCYRDAAHPHAAMRDAGRRIWRRPAKR